jgi:septum formation protein
MTPTVILASKSPRRQELIKGLGLNYEVHTYDVDESFPPELKAAEICEYLAQKKAGAFPRELDGKVLITADTIVWINDQVLNKPEDAEDAFRMLKILSGATHEVFTGVCLRSATLQKVFSERTEVTCRLLSDDEIRYYISSFKPFDKAGSYGIQDWFGYTAVERINGCFYNVMGLPVSRVYKELSAF